MALEVVDPNNSYEGKKTTFDLDWVYKIAAELRKFLQENPEPTEADAGSECAKCPFKGCQDACEVTQFITGRGYLVQKREEVRRARTRLEWLNQILAAGGEMPDSRITSPLGELC